MTNTKLFLRTQNPFISKQNSNKGYKWFIDWKKGECDIAFKIGPARFTFTFLVSNEFTQDVILGYNFSKAFHIGTDLNKSDEMFLTMNNYHWHKGN